MVATQFGSILEDAYSAIKQLQTGCVADYIPELASADPKDFALASCSVSGQVHVVGDETAGFTIQSMCKPFLYAAALQEYGPEHVHRFVGVEPTGRAFDSFIRLASGSGLPHNPMVNAGAIAVSALLAKRHDASWLLDTFRRYAARSDIHVDMPVYLSEKATADRNRAIAYLLRYVDGLEADVDSTLEFYFQACSILVTVRDVATMAATLANAGTNPISGERVVSSTHVRDVLTIMMTCGMYDGAGRFAFETGLPAKSGVSGGVLATVPGRMGIAGFSPRLDERGNSVRGIAALKRLSKALDLDVFSVTGKQPVHEYDAKQPIAALVSEVARDAAKQPTGTPVSYASKLANIDPTIFGIAMCGVDGSETASGDREARFSMQAVANPFTYAMALEKVGRDAVHCKVGVEPSGNPFDAVRFEPKTRLPYNPVGNAGAITITSLLPGSDAVSRLKALLAWFSALAGTRSVPVDAAILTAERRAGDRNRAIAHLLKNFGVVDDVDVALELYFQQCAVLVNCVELARMGATLAGGGQNPLTGQQLIAPEHARCVTSVMYMCGLHDESGRFAFDAGIPSKSGASGAIVAVVPGRCGIAVYSPGIDSSGTSERGARALQKLARGLGLGLFDPRGDG